MRDFLFPRFGATRPSGWTAERFAARAAIFGAALCGCSLAQTPSRERISLNHDWRFHHGDPPENSVSLLYDVRPPVGENGQDEPVKEPDSPSALPAPATAGIKPWILPSGNEFIKDPSRRFARPSGNPGDGVAYVQPDFNDHSWQSVNLPHDWAIAGPFSSTGGGGMGRLPSAGIGWYRKQLSIPQADAGKDIFLDVDGAMSYATVWLNGHLIGGWPYGYASWRVDLTPYVKPGGENELAIRLDNPPRSSRWYPGGGIYRNVWLVKTNPLHVSHWGTYLTTPVVSTAAATIKLQVTVNNDTARDATVEVASRIFLLDAGAQKVGPAVATIAPVSLALPSAGSAVAEGTATVAHPKLWGPPPQQIPNRYVAVTTVSQQGRVIDVYETRFGIRTLKFDPNGGFLINGERIALNGVCNHHDLGSLGAALNVRALQRQLELLREMGCNAIRTSHNPPAPELLELTDKMGFLVLDEAFDVWLRKKTSLDYHLIFSDWHEPDLRAFVRRDRNCPSVVMWSIGNEMGEQLTDADGAALARQLNEIVHEEDSTRPTTSAMNWAKPTGPFAAAVDVIGLNYQGAGIRGTPGRYPDFHDAFPATFIFGSETASAFSSRGEYLFPVDRGVSATVGETSGEDPARHHVSAYELYCAPFGSSADKVFASQEQHPFVGGEFVWTGWDYLGEPTPFDSSRSSYSGIIDLAGFKKDRFYLYQAHWRPDFPMAHLLPHWTWPERVGQVTPVHVFTSGDEGELFLNGRSLGRKKRGPFEYRLRWDDVVYEPGTLEVVTYQHGAQWATDRIKTAGSPARLTLKPDRSAIRADGRDVSFVTVTVTDRDGGVAPRANDRIHFDLAGPGEIVATDNGDPTCLESFQIHDRQAFNGLCLVIVRGQAGQPGKIVLTASANGLKVGTATITTTPDARGNE